MALLADGQPASEVLQALDGTLWSSPVAANTPVGPNSGYLNVVAASCLGCSDILLAKNRGCGSTSSSSVTQPTTTSGSRQLFTTNFTALKFTQKNNENKTS